MSNKIIIENTHFTQNKFSNKTEFDFKEQGFDYTHSDKSGVRNLFVPYSSMHTKNHNVFIEKREWFRNIGYIWVICGLAFYLTGTTSFSIFILIGAACLVRYYFVQVKFIIFRSDNGNIYIIDDIDKDKIIDKIVQGQRDTVLKEYGAIDYSRTFEKEKAKYKYFLDEGIIELDKFNEYLATMEGTKDKFTEA